MERRKKWQKAFTLVELMVVVTIIGILASIASIKVVQYLKKARVVKAKADMNRIVTALKLFNMEFHDYPESLDELTEQTDEHPEGIMSGIPNDPWGNEYEYVAGTEHGFDLICYGRDGTEGGEGEDADIYSWELEQPEGEEGDTGEYSEGTGE
jgi:general secretion pathway protein G